MSSAALLPLLALPVFADDVVIEIAPSTSRLGGRVDAYSDIAKGWSIYKPSTWNKFDAAPGEYEAKWQDVVGASEQLIVRRVRAARRMCDLALSVYRVWMRVCWTARCAGECIPSDGGKGH